MLFTQLLLLSLLSLSCATQLAYYKHVTTHPDYNLTITQFLDKYSYKHETHYAETVDGYILGLHRITSKRNEDEDPEADKPVVLLIHGLGSSAVDFINLGPGKSIGLMLADEGYDVWLGNCRGTTWSRNHTTLDPSTDKSFWDYSFHEMGVYDAPAKIDYILNVTGKETLSYIGHSQGTSTFFAMASTRPEYNDKINVMAALAPIGYMSKFPNPVVKLMAEPIFQLIIAAVIYTLKMYEIFPHLDLYTKIGGDICCEGCVLQNLCADVVYIFGGYGPEQFDKSFLPVLLSNAPAGASYKMIAHYLQEIRSGAFRPYDYGVGENRNHYKIGEYDTAVPPEYAIANIKAPVVLFYSENDAMAAVEDVEMLASKLPNVEKKLIAYENFTHLDFIWAIDIVEYLNLDLVNLLNEHNNKPLVTTTSTESTSAHTTSAPVTTTDSPETTTQGSGALVSSMKMIVFVVSSVYFMNMFM